MKTLQLPDETRVSRLHLRTADLGRALDFYHRVIGLKLIHRTSNEAALSATGVDPALLVLSEDPDATPRIARTTGLYHFALRFPKRSDLANAARRLALEEYPIEGASDHGVSEALYLSDPDHNGIELYTDRPRAEWPRSSDGLKMITEPLDFDSLMSEADSGSNPRELPSGTDIGHIHLHVADLERGERFFSEFLRLEVMQRIPNNATFLSAGGYHHHIAINVWAGKVPALKNAVGLVSYRLEVPITEVLFCMSERARVFGYETNSLTSASGEKVLQIRDPNGNWLELEFTPVGSGVEAVPHGPE